MNEKELLSLILGDVEFDVSSAEEFVRRYAGGLSITPPKDVFEREFFEKMSGAFSAAAKLAPKAVHELATQQHKLGFSWVSALNSAGHSAYLLKTVIEESLSEGTYQFAGTTLIETLGTAACKPAASALLKNAAIFEACKIVSEQSMVELIQELKEVLETPDIAPGHESAIWDTLEGLGKAEGRTDLRHPDWPRIEVYEMSSDDMFDSFQVLVTVGQRVERGDALILGKGGIGEASVEVRHDGVVAKVQSGADKTTVHVYRGVDTPS